MSKIEITCLAAAAVLPAASAQPSNAQSIGYAQAIDRLGVSCGKDIEKLCKKANLGGGRVAQCLNQNRAAVSSNCKASVTEMTALLTTRAQARAAVLRVCDVDVRRFCPGIQPGDGNSSSRIEAVGLGEEQLLKPANPEAEENRRVQLINIGRGR